MSQHSIPKVITLTQAISGRLHHAELEQRELSGQWPRTLLFEQTLRSAMLNERFLETVPNFRKRLYSYLPIHIAQVLEAFIIQKRYDVVISWAENLGLPFAALEKVTGSRTPHIGIFSWISKPKKALFLKLVQSHFDRLVLMSSAQRDFAVKNIGIPEEKIAFLRWPVDLKFWHPMKTESTDLICSVGREMRDYVTLINVVKEMDIRCHIAAGGLTHGNKKDAWIEQIGGLDHLPPNITVGKKNYHELRELYASSKFVVIPILPTDTDNGTTSILEAMAMGKAVICSKTDGQRDVIEDGKNGIFVTPNNPGELKAAIEYLLKNPDIAEKMGMEGRKHVEQYHSLDEFVLKIRDIVSDAYDRKKNNLKPVRTPEPGKKKRALTVISSGIGRPANEEIKKMELNDQLPRILYFEETIDSDILDEQYLAKAPKRRRLLYSFMPTLFSQAIEAFIVRGRYEIVVTWSERNVFLFALLLKLFGKKYPHVAMMSWLSRPPKLFFLKNLHSAIDRIIVWSSVQRDIAVSEGQVPAEKVVLVSRRVDTQFWHPIAAETNTISAVGQEMRDYPTLIHAMQGLNIPCHIATGEFYGKLHETVKKIDTIKEMPSNISIGKLSNIELRSLYARSRFVVIPLLQSDTDNGVTAIEESMAMGKAVICSRTKGQVDIIQHGITGIFVPPGDHGALRDAITDLWNNPQKAEEMGKNAREYISQHHSLEQFVSSVDVVINDVINKHRRS